jgi:hypothetical protein
MYLGSKLLKTYIKNEITSNALKWILARQLRLINDSVDVASYHQPLPHLPWVGKMSPFLFG